MAQWMLSIRLRAQALKREIHALYLALKDPRTPWYAKAIGFIVIGYAMSPIDLIPDFIPVLGYLDDVILLPLGLLLFRALVPGSVLDDCRVRASKHADRPRSVVAAALIVIVWAACLAMVAYLAHHWLKAQRVRAG